jgi:DNA-binding transcriptional LysR family regulator
MDVDSIKILTEVVHLGSFAAVARRRNVDPSSISRVIAGLEQELGFRLFQRSTRHLSLTEAGSLYFERVENLIEDIAAAADVARDLSAEATGTLRVTASVAYGQTVLVPRLPAFQAANPRLMLDLVFTDATVDLVAERIDLAIRLGRRPSVDLICSRLLPIHYRVCANPIYLAARGHPQNPKQLADHNCLRFPFPHFRDHWRFRCAEEEEEIEVEVNGTPMISSALALRACALAGMGAALLADWLVDDDIAEGRLVNLFPTYEVTATDFDMGVWALYQGRSYLPWKTRAFIDFLRASLKTPRSVAHALPTV